MFVRDSGKWATVLAEGLPGAVASGLCNLLNNTTLCANWSLPWGVLRS